ncbi:MAG: DUF1236 domain-containing protein [Paracoccus sp. (in: a-proteobacteria)]|nr:DUF1236 domain-containing protein [Paracoccus sp. (in: a-proteobacteria)]
MRTLFASTIAATIAFAGAASAETAAKAGTDLNMRSGPGVQYEVSGVIPGGEDVTVIGCIESANWCQVKHKDAEGWAYGDYLAAKMGEEFQPILPHRTELEITTVEYQPVQPTGQDTAVGAGTGAAMGALIAGPLGAVIGAAAGGTVANVTPPPEVHTYITEHQVEPVLLDGEVVTGAGIPETVTLHDIPDQTEKYVVINGQAVLVNPENRQIVYIYR